MSEFACLMINWSTGGRTKSNEDQNHTCVCSDTKNRTVSTKVAVSA